MLTYAHMILEKVGVFDWIQIRVKTGIVLSSAVQIWDANSKLFLAIMKLNFSLYHYHYINLVLNLVQALYTETRKQLT